MAATKVAFDARSQMVSASTLPPLCIYCGGQAEGAPVRKSIPYLSNAPRDPLAPPPQVVVELPVCHPCRGRSGKGISAEPKKGWVILGGVADRFAAAMAQILDEQAAAFERGIVQSPPDEKRESHSGGFDWSSIQ